MSPVLLTVMPSDPGFLVHGPDDQIVVKPFDDIEDSLDFLAWCSENRCPASPLFSYSIHYQGGRAWKVIPADDDAAFALKLRWL